MKIKIKNQGQLIDATIEVVDGVMIVSPKEEKLDITKFKDGDVITCGHHYCDGFQWTAILQGEIERIADNMLIGDYCSLDCKGEFLDHNSGSDSATWVRYATEEEKKILFDKLEEKGYEFDFEKKELIKLKWEPNYGSPYYIPAIKKAKIAVTEDAWAGNEVDKMYYDKGWAFRTKEECQELCNRLNDAINQVKP